MNAVAVPNRSDADWASPGAEWFRLSDHLPYVVDLDLDGAGTARVITAPSRTGWGSARLDEDVPPGFGP